MTVAPMEDLLTRARTHVRELGRMPTKSELRSHLGCRFERASEVHAELLAEQPSGEFPQSSPSSPSPSPPSQILPAGEDLGRPPEVREDAGRLPEVWEDMPEDPFPTAPADPPRLPDPPQTSRRPPARTWPIMLLALPAFVAIWSGWVDLGRLTGFGVVHPLPGIWDAARLNTAITLPIGLEAYAAYAAYVWLVAEVPPGARTFARRSAIGSLVVGFAGQAIYHLMIAAGWSAAPWPVTLLVSGVPVAVFGMGMSLMHLVRAEVN